MIKRQRNGGLKLWKLSVQKRHRLQSAHIHREMRISGLLFTSGQIPIDPATGEVVEAEITAQAKQSIENVGQVLAAGGSSFEKVIKTTCFLADMKDFAAFNEVYAKYFTTNPARSCVAVKTLPKGVLCEVEVIAER